MTGITLPANLQWQILTIVIDDDATLHLDFAAPIGRGMRNIRKGELSSDSANEKLIKDFATLKTLLAQNPNVKKLELSPTLFTEIVAADQLSNFYFALIGSHLTDLYMPIRAFAEDVPVAILIQFREFLRHSGIANVYLTGNGDFLKHSKITIRSLLQNYVPCDIHLRNDFNRCTNGHDRLVQMIPKLAGNIVIIYDTSGKTQLLKPFKSFLNSLYTTFALQKVDLILDQNFVTSALALEQSDWENLCRFLKKPNVVSLTIKYESNLQAADESQQQQNQRLADLLIIAEIKQQPSFPSLQKLALTRLNCKFFPTVDKISGETSQAEYSLIPQLENCLPSRDMFFFYWLTSKHDENDQVPLQAFGLMPINAVNGDLSELSTKALALTAAFCQLIGEFDNANTLKLVKDNYFKLVRGIISVLPANIDAKVRYRLLYELSKFNLLDTERFNPHTQGLCALLWKWYRSENGYKTTTRKTFDMFLELNDPTGKFAKEIAAEQQVTVQLAQASHL
jgi:hypothetical protein